MQILDLRDAPCKASARLAIKGPTARAGTRLLRILSMPSDANLKKANRHVWAMGLT